MITVPTTLVLGAGASKPYGFPSGAELRTFLADHVNLKGMYQYGFDQRDIKVFADTFRNSGMSSIDTFLARRGGHKVGQLTTHTYSDIGKAAIAYCLIQREFPGGLFATNQEDHWYQYLWSLIADSLESFGANKLSIITFNYDRSLEQYLLTALQNSFGLSAEEAASHLRKIPILHVYGQIGLMPELAPDSLGGRYYSPELSAAHIKVAADNLRVIDESRDDDVVFEKAYSYLQDAKRICFLGFGFDETNMKRLGIDRLIKYYRATEADQPRVGATTLGMEDAERNKILHRLRPSKFELPSIRSDIVDYRLMKNEQYLRATGLFL
ncbi:MAG: hypothetical protein PHH36_03830 [Sideroxydans sp.]|nr:hypothetical protein [Sideroxydans sp.]